MFKEQEQYPKSTRFGWYCLPNLAKLFYGGSRKYENWTEPQAMFPGDA